jgi:hypothetical protein
MEYPWSNRSTISETNARGLRTTSGDKPHARDCYPYRYHYQTPLFQGLAREWSVRWRKWPADLP